MIGVEDGFENLLFFILQEIKNVFYSMIYQFYSFMILVD